MSNNKLTPEKVTLPALGELHESEHRLILAIRHKYRFSEVKILTRHGLPYRLKITERFEDLNSDSYVAENSAINTE